LVKVTRKPAAIRRFSLDFVCVVLQPTARPRRAAAQIRFNPVETRLFEWAEELRTMGNEGAHGVESVISREDANDTVESQEALIEDVFTY
jgi:hypothetical protein